MSTTKRDVVPSFALYGEAPNNNLPDLIHVEALKDRSQLHGWQIKPHRHAGLVQIIDFKTPNVRIDLDGVIKKTDSPSILMVPPTVVHGFEFAPDVVGSVTTIPQDLFIDTAATTAPWVQPAALISEHDNSFVHLAQILQQIEDEYTSQRPARESALLFLVRLIGVWIERIRPAEADVRGIDVYQSPAQRRVRSFLDLVERGYLEGWSALDYGKVIGVSKSQLTRDCRAILGRSPLQVIHDRIIKEANRKLAYTPLSVAEISDRLGFTDLGYFSRFYRQKTGKTPTDYRGRIRRQMHRKP
ncbi:MAG: helix-turn-helix domain-containing protein [Pseudomonadota bacterium]